MGRTIAFIAAAVISGSLFWSCEGSATQTTNGQCLHGALVDAQGHAVSGAKVMAWPIGAIGNPGAQGGTPAALAETDAQGRYALDGLTAGEFNVFGEKGSGSSTVLIPRVHYAETELDLGTDTLRPPGAITGRVLSGDKPMPEVFCYIPGSAYVAMTDSLGRFTLSQVSAGTYRVKYTTEGHITAVDSPVVVVSAEITALAAKDMVIDDALQPPPPDGLTADIDSVTGIVTLRWNKAPVNDVASYEIQRRLVGASDPYLADYDIMPTSQGYPTVTGTEVNDDRTRSEFGWFSAWPTQDTGTVFYRVRTVDTDGNKSHTYSAPVSLVLKRRLFQNLDLDVIETGGIYHAPLCRDTLVFAASVSNPVFDEAAIHFDVVAWFDGAKPLTYIYTQKTWKGMVKADTLAWYLGKPVEYAALPVPPGKDSLWWVNEGRIVPASDLGTPDSLKVLVDSYVYDVDGLQTAVRRIMDVSVDGQGCYVVGESRRAKNLGEPFNP
ncbi:MAG: carboxypeptidase-like regulatory domain-containing protein [Fibrobacteria bacterium]